MSPTATGGTPYVAVAAAGVARLGTTVAVAVIPGLRFAYESLELHVALESAQGVVALLLCYLAFGRLRTTLRLRDLLLTGSFAAFASTNLFVSALSVALNREATGFSTWMAAGLRLVAVLMFAAAAIAPDRLLSPRRLATRSAVVSATVLVVLVAGAALADANLAQLVDPNLSPEASRNPLITGHPLAVGIQVAATVAMAGAAIAFVIRARRTGDDLFRWLAAGAMLGAFARLNYVLFPSLYTEWFYTGDLLRFGSYLLFLVGAAREIGAYWRDHADMAVMTERRRVARELHDGLTQELAFIRSHLSSIPEGGLSPEMARHVSEAAERALRESRGAVQALTGAWDGQSLADALRNAAEAVAHREQVTIRFEADSSVPTHSTVRPALERIVREAVVNAIRHGRASTVTIRIAAVESSLIVQVVDGGGGFVVTAASGGRGFGLVSIRQRTEALGGDFRIESSPGIGTTVNVVVPLQLAT